MSVMETLSTPAPFAPLSSCPAVRFRCGESDLGKYVSIRDHDGKEELGRKFIYEYPKTSLSLEAYLRPQFDLVPFGSETNGIHASDRYTAGCTVAFEEGTLPVTATAGDRIRYDSFLTEEKVIEITGNACLQFACICKGGWIELFHGDAEEEESAGIWQIPDTEEYTYYIFTHAPEHSVVREAGSVVLNTPSGCDRVRFRSAARLEPHSVQLFWVNRFGAIDQCSAPLLPAIRRKFVKRYELGQMTENRSHTGRSFLIKDASDESLSLLNRILSSPKAWIKQEEDFIPIVPEPEQIVVDEGTAFIEVPFYFENPIKNLVL